MTVTRDTVGICVPVDDVKLVVVFHFDSVIPSPLSTVLLLLHGRGEAKILGGLLSNLIENFT